MWIRNKGTRTKPSYVLVESRRVASKRHPQQKVICYMGELNDFQALISRWEMLSKDARIAQRKGISIKDRDKYNPLLKQYARGLSLKEINLRLRKFKESEFRYSQHREAKKSMAKIKGLKLSRKDFDPHMISEFNSEALTLILSIYKIRSGQLVSHWKPHIRRGIKEKLKEIVKFYNEI